ncbi:zinc finger domain-containing protein [Pseudovirgaria hyperparasitica]|uniref:Zinc finger domain-containing protein n=1 Tax=Pseudovirgaria hyperparasitica TaxID=470096 RepID=A0A6A6WH74_9PEZI|nr:zinc finger domain-containing protein [Pseudovirgaria hyperparasitica]KAF2761420.1 zinc finger domain-containing protein [Pseudovirgaria hyperparasitica]
MPPRNYVNPAPQTESARDAARNFFCDLCQKAYARQPELDSHLTSYEHNHQKRLQDLKEASRDPGRTERQRRKENAEAGLVRLDLDGAKKAVNDANPSVEKKKGGFKPMTMKRNDDKSSQQSAAPKPGFKRIGGAAVQAEEPKSIFDDLGYEVYDPRYPTECDEI